MSGLSAAGTRDSKKFDEFDADAAFGAIAAVRTMVVMSRARACERARNAAARAALCDAGCAKLARSLLMRVLVLLPRGYWAAVAIGLLWL